MILTLKVGRSNRAFSWGCADGWSTRERGIDGKLEADPKKFPSGLKSLSDRLAGMGKSGMLALVSNCQDRQWC